jgi:hypothetical protein
MSKSSLLKNARNYAEYLRKKERGPVKAFFHITKNENVPAIEQQGLLTNHPNANINSANHPFRKHGTDAGGVWVTTEPTAFPVYGTTIGGKNGNAAARADALSTIKIEVPLPELRKMRAVQDPYGKNILRKGDDPRAVEKFGTWAGVDVPTTVLLNDVKPQWLKDIGYVEEASNTYNVTTMPEFNDLAGSWGIYPDNENFKHLRFLSKGDLRDYSGYTGHRHGTGSYEKSPRRFVDEYIDKNQSIMERLPEFPVAAHPNRLGRLQGAIIRDDETNALKRFGNQPLAFDWSNEYLDYVKPGESVENRRQFEFAPGAISRGMGGGRLPSVKDRNFDWAVYNDDIRNGNTPRFAAFEAQPLTKLNWDNIVSGAGGYEPEIISSHDFDAINEGAISRGTPYNMKSSARMAQVARRKAANDIHRWRNMTDNAQVVKDYGVSMTDDELRELDRLEAKITPKGVSHLPGAATWSKLENPEILRTRQRALDKIKGSWLYDYLLGK